MAGLVSEGEGPEDMDDEEEEERKKGGGKGLTVAEDSLTNVFDAVGDVEVGGMGRFGALFVGADVPS